MWWAQRSGRGLCGGLGGVGGACVLGSAEWEGPVWWAGLVAAGKVGLACLRGLWVGVAYGGERSRWA